MCVPGVMDRTRPAGHRDPVVIDMESAQVAEFQQLLLQDPVVRSFPEALEAERNGSGWEGLQLSLGSGQLARSLLAVVDTFLILLPEAGLWELTVPVVCWLLSILRC